MKRKRKGSKKPDCKQCGKEVAYHACKFCKECIEIGWDKTYPDIPYIHRALEYEIKLNQHNGANKFNKIRAWARTTNKDSLKKCQKCGYTKHVEVCHKKSISSFDKKTLLTEINSKDNLLFLCPNCHWEHDNL